MTGAVVGASDAVLIPVQASGLDLWGTQEVMGVVERQVQSAGLRAAFVASRRDTRTRMAAQIGQALAERFDLPVFEGTAQRIAYARAMTQGRTALDGYDDKATAEISQLLEDIAQLLRTDRTCHE
jgi:chromosome partitioning protein